MKRLFGTTGIRGFANKDLTPEFACKAALAFSKYLLERWGNKPVVIGRDTRTSSYMLTLGVAAGLISSGLDVYLGGIAPTPAVHATCLRNQFAGISVTGSHIPPEMNGMKFINPDGREVWGEQEREIERIFFSENFSRAEWNKLGLAGEWDVLGDYYEVLMDFAGDYSFEGFRVVLDCGNATASVIMPYVLRELGCEVITLNSDPSGIPGREFEPNPESLSNLAKLVVESGADLGVGYDGDADRAIFVTEDGRVIMGDISGAIIAKNLLKSGDKLVTPVSTSSLIDDIASEVGFEVIRTRVGAAEVIGRAFEIGARFAFEENGGCIFLEHNPCRDGGLTTIMMLKILKDEGRKLSELVDSLPRYYQQKMKVRCPDDYKQYVLEKVAERFSGEKVDRTDGIKVFLEDGWILLRPSGTEPVFRVFAESKDKRKAEELARMGVKIVREILREVGISG